MTGPAPASARGEVAASLAGRVHRPADEL